MNKSILLFFLYLLLVNTFLFSQKNPQSQIDSLETVLKTSVPDTVRIKTLLKLCDIFRANDPQKAISYLTKASALSHQLNYKKGIAESFYLEGLLEYGKGNLADSKKKYNEARIVYDELNDKMNVAKMIYNIGIIDVYSGDYVKANESFFKTLHIYELLDNKEQIGNCYTAIGNVYGRQGHGEKELEFHQKCLLIRLKENDKYGISASYINIGNAFSRRLQYDTALSYYFKGLKMAEEINHKKWIINSMGNIGTVYAEQKKYPEALTYLSKVLEMAREMEDKKTICTTLNSLGSLSSNTGDYIKAGQYIEEALLIARETGNKEEIKAAYSNLAMVANKTGDFKKAYEYHIMFSDIKDSIFNEESSSQINEMQVKYDTKKQEQEITLLNKDKELQSINLKQQKLVIVAVVFGLLLVMIFALFIFREYREKKKANTALQYAYQEIEEKNKDITDSINYAKRIQTAILPGIETIQKFLPESFIFYQPKDIVSGDFYWFAEKDNKLLIAVADCTGHGVPGAFMSMIGNDLLTQIVIEKGITSPNLILTHLHNGVKNALKQDTEDSKTRDGMDIAVVSISRNNNTILEFAGALRPLWISKNNASSITEFKADKHSIGGAYSSDQREFTNHSIELHQGDSFYLSTDGFADQFGGVSGKKFMTKNMKELLISLQTTTMDHQRKELQKTFNDWKENSGQVDDVLVIGVRI